MVRPRRHRWVRREPGVVYFKPQGVRLSELGWISLNVEELEAVRLKDHQKLDQNTAATRMKVSQPTFHRIYSDARAKIAKALVEGLAIKIHGGVYKMPGGSANQRFAGLQSFSYRTQKTKQSRRVEKMPGGDRTGPTGQGPMTGRGMGPCGRGRGFGRGPGMGFGRGFGWRRSADVQPLTKDEEKRLLEEEKQEIEKRLKEIGE